MKTKIISIAVALTCVAGMAQAESINFSGTVSTSCSFGANSAGVLNAYAQGNEYKLDAGYNSGSPSTVDITYTGAPTFTIDSVANVSGSNGMPSLTGIQTGASFSKAGNQSAAITAGANNFTSGNKSFQLDGQEVSDTLSVRMLATATSPFAVGTYSAQTTVTCQ